MYFSREPVPYGREAASTTLLISMIWPMFGALEALRKEGREITEQMDEETWRQDEKTEVGDEPPQQARAHQ